MRSVADSQQRSSRRAFLLDDCGRVRLHHDHHGRDVVDPARRVGGINQLLTGVDGLEVCWRIVRISYPFRLCDGGHIVLRAKVGLQIANLLQGKQLRDVSQCPLECTLRIDLFDPPQRAQFREQVMAGRDEVDASGLKRPEREVAKSLGLTITAAQRAAALDRLMRLQGLTDPYILLTEPPEDYAKLRRHRHRRYHFAPLPRHVPAW